MRPALVSLVALFAAIGPVYAQNGAYAQCGGVGWSGSTSCISGYGCVKVNDYYYQCQPGASQTITSSTPAPTTPTSTTNPPSSTVSGPTVTNSACSGNLTPFKYFGVNQAGAEFGETKIPGVLGTDYTWPVQSSIDYFVNQRFNSFRIPFKVERLNPPSQGLTGSFDQTYLNGMKTIVNYITNKGAYAIIDPHNFMRYNNNIITDTNAFSTWWRNLANEFKSNPRVIFDIMNEPNTMDASVVFNLNQAAVNAIRATGATQLILVEGTSWTGAWTWVSSGNAAAFQSLRDPNNNTAVEMHQYLDSDGSGTSDICVSATIGAERLQAATNWLKQTGLKGFLGEIGSGSNNNCVSAVKGALCSMQQSGVWIGIAWWSAGPWWGTYFQSLEPPNGPSIARILPEALKPFIY